MLLSHRSNVLLFKRCFQLKCSRYAIYFVVAFSYKTAGFWNRISVVGYLKVRAKIRTPLFGGGVGLHFSSSTTIDVTFIAQNILGKSPEMNLKTDEFASCSTRFKAGHLYFETLTEA